MGVRQLAQARRLLRTDLHSDTSVDVDQPSDSR